MLLSLFCSVCQDLPQPLQAQQCLWAVLALRFSEHPLRLLYTGGQPVDPASDLLSSSHSWLGSHFPPCPLLPTSTPPVPLFGFWAATS